MSLLQLAAKKSDASLKLIRDPGSTAIVYQVVHEEEKF